MRPTPNLMLALAVLVGAPLLGGGGRVHAGLITTTKYAEPGIVVRPTVTALLANAWDEDLEESAGPSIQATHPHRDKAVNRSAPDPEWITSFSANHAGQAPGPCSDSPTVTNNRLSLQPGAFASPPEVPSLAATRSLDRESSRLHFPDSLRSVVFRPPR